MSVVNKMLQDLEARQTQSDEIKADYQAPPKKQSRSLIILLLVLAIAAIIFALTDSPWLFSENESKIKFNQAITATNTHALAANPPQKMAMATEKTQQQPVMPQNNMQLAPKTENLIASETLQIDKPRNGLTVKPEQPIQTITKETLIAPIQVVDSRETPVDSSISPEVMTSTTAEQTSSFSKSHSSKESSSSSLKQRIVESLNEDDLELARSLLYELLETEPANINARKKLASLQFAHGNYAQAKQLLIKGITLHSDQGDLRLMLARLLMIQKKPSQAIDTLSEFQPVTGNQVEYLGYRAALAQQLKQTKLAMSDYQSLTQIEPSNAKWWLGLGIAKDQLGEIDLALKAYANAKSLDQLDRSVHDFIQQRISVLVGDQ